MAEAREALERELRALHGASYGWALACSRFSPELAFDVLQESYARVLSGKARYGGQSAFRTWFFGVIRHVAREMRRAERMREALATLLQRELPPPAVRADESSDVSALKRALAALPTRQREVLSLTFWQGCSVDEAAGVMQISVGSARQHYARAKAALRRQLGEREEDR